MNTLLIIKPQTASNSLKNKASVCGSQKQSLGQAKDNILQLHAHEGGQPYQHPLEIRQNDIMTDIRT